MSTGSLARRYARAFFTASPTAELTGAMAAFGSLVEALASSDDFKQVLTSPAFGPTERNRVIGAVLDRLNPPKAARRFIDVLIEANRFDALPDITRELERLINEQQGRVKAEITSVAGLDPQSIGRLQKSLADATGKAIVLTEKRDPAILGGVIAKVGDVIIDGSLRSQLHAIRDRIEDTGH